jgi:hypothetical protein
MNGSAVKSPMQLLDGQLLINVLCSTAQDPLSRYPYFICDLLFVPTEIVEFQAMKEVDSLLVNEKST